MIERGIWESVRESESDWKWLKERDRESEGGIKSENKKISKIKDLKAISFKKPIKLRYNPTLVFVNVLSHFSH